MSTLKVSTVSNLAGTNSTSADNVISGSAKAWVNFNGTGTVAIRQSYNVSSITDDGTGLYRINFTTALADANYSLVMTCQEDSGGGGRFANGRGTQTSSVAYIESRNASNTSIDPQNFWAAVFR